MMKKLRKLLLALAVCALCLLLLPGEAKAASASDLWFSLNADGESYSVVNCSSDASGKLTIPSKYNNLPVTAIGSNAFYWCNDLTSVTIPDTVTVIGEDAFANCYGLRSIVIPNGVKTIGNSAFDDCYNVSEIIIAESVTTIGAEAFCGCENVKAVEIGKGVTSIGEGAFAYCDALTGVYVADIASWCKIAFADLEANPLHIAQCLYVKNSPAKEIVIPNTVTEIGDYTFVNCKNLTKVTLPDSITRIGAGAFYGCEKLSDITIPRKVTQIGADAFNGCVGLAAVYAADVASWCKIDFADMESNPLGYAKYLYLGGKLATNLAIPSTITAIDDYAFNGCKNITAVVIPDSVATIGNSAFRDCISLSTLFIGNSVTKIGGYAFSGCEKLKAVTIPDSVSILSGYAFSGCYELKIVEIGSGVKQLPSGVFSACYALNKVLLDKALVGIGANAFSYCEIEKVYYTGSQADWDDISFKSGNSNLQKAELVLGFTGGTVHSYGTWKTVKSATCTADGSRQRTCLECNAVQTQVIAATGHKYSGYTCTVCKQIFPLQVTAYNRSATVISTGGANIWSQPYTSGTSKKIRTAQYTAKLTVVGKATNASGSLWYKLSDGNWVYSTSIRVTDYDPGDVESCNKTFVVTSWGANIWSKPYSSGDSKVAYSVEKTDALKAVAQVKNSTGGLWYQLADGNWVYSKNVNERIFDPADVIAYKRSATVIVPGVINIWGQPSTKAPSTLTRTAAYQTKLNVVARYTTSTGGLWYQLTDGNWVYSTNIRITDYDPADVLEYQKDGRYYCKIATVTSWGANIWSKPYSSGDSKVVKTVEKGTLLSVVAEVRNSTYGLWYQIPNVGWIYSKNVSVK